MKINKVKKDTTPQRVKCVLIFVTALRWGTLYKRSIVMSLSVCLSVCSAAYIRNHTGKLHQIFHARYQ